MTRTSITRSRRFPCSTIRRSVLSHAAIVSLAAMAALAGCSGGVADKYRPTAPITRWDDSEWATVLSAVVARDGLVDYSVLKENRSGVRDTLYTYVGKLGAVSPDSDPALFPTEADKLAYWINAYNAICMYRIVERGYPGNVIASVPPAAIFFVDSTPVGGKSMTLDSLEKSKVLSKGDPRVHFALNCASYSCPPLRDEPYSGPKLNAQLAEQGRIYLSDPRAVRPIDANTVGLNNIFTDFYKGDFTRGGLDLLPSLKRFAAPDSPVQSATNFRSIGYDWSLNSAR